MTRPGGFEFGGGGSGGGTEANLNSYRRNLGFGVGKNANSPRRSDSGPSRLNGATRPGGSELDRSRGDSEFGDNGGSRSRLGRGFGIGRGEL